MANFLSRIFGFGKTRSLEANNAPELVELCQFEKHIDALLKRDNRITGRFSDPLKMADVTILFEIKML